MTTPHPCRLSLVFAREAPICVILRRGPSRWVEVIKWNTSSDQFEYGPWFHGRIYGERCGLSPNGSLFVYFAMKFGRVDTVQGYAKTYTAVSRPPYLAALAMWPQGDTWGGGGRFINDNTLRLAYGSQGTSHPGVADTEIHMAPMPKTHLRHRCRGLRIQTDLNYYEPDAGFKVKSGKDGNWSGRDHGGRSIIARRGGLIVVDKSGAETLLHDFNLDTRRDVVPPEWAQKW
jgi:hypothetical protein